MRKNLEARMGAGGQPVGPAGHARRQHQGARAARLRRERETARGGQIVDFLKAPYFADHRRHAAAFQGLLHGPQGVFRAGCVDEDEGGGVEAMEGKSRAIRRAPFNGGEILDDPDDGGAAGRRRGREARREREGEAAGRRAIARSPRRDLVQGAPRRPPRNIRSRPPMLMRGKGISSSRAIFWRKKASRSDLPAGAFSENVPDSSSRRIFLTRSGGFA